MFDSPCWFPPSACGSAASPASYLLANTFQLGVYGVWYAMVLDWVFRAAFYLWRYFGTKWLRMKVI